MTDNPTLPAAGVPVEGKDLGGGVIRQGIMAGYRAGGSADPLQDIVAALGLLGTQTTLAAMLAKIIAAPATEAKQDTANTALAAIASLLTTQAGYLDGIEGLITTTNGKDFATQTTLAAVLAAVAAATPAGENHTGQVGGHTSIVPVTLSLDTSIYASGEVLADTQVVANAVRINDGTGMLHSLMVIDQDDQGVAFDLYVLSANVSMGTENAAPSITDANAVNILGRVQVGASDYYDLGGVKVANLRNLALLVKAETGTRNVYVAAVNGAGTPTFTASGIKLGLGLLND